MDQISPEFDDVFKAIEAEILAKFKEFEFEISDNAKKALSILAKNDRKKFSLNSIFGRFAAQKILDELLSANFISIEKSREKPPQKLKHQKLKKSLRRYKITDKIIISRHFLRFYFYFIYPNLALLEAGKTAAVMEKIRNEFENYAAFGFEILSAQLMARAWNLEFFEVSSFWNKDDEIDIFAEFEGGILVGEVKYKNRKISKNTLNLLQLKCQNLGLFPSVFALFSRSGFSNELEKMRSEKIRLFGIDDYKILLQ